MDPLLKAVKSGCLESVQRVVSSTGLPIDSRWIDYLAVNQAIVDERPDIAGFLLDRLCRVKNTRANVVPHETPLHSAVKRNMPAIVTKLLEKGASVEILNDRGYSPLHLALILEHDASIDAILDFVRRTRGYANTRSRHGLTHFHVACTRRNSEVVEGFVASGVDVDEAVDADSDYRPGYTARHFAAEFRSLQAVRVLAKKTTTGRVVLDKNGKSPEDLARESLEELQVMVYLLSGESRGSAGMSQFHVACTQANPGLVRKFLENGAVVNNSTVAEDATFCPGFSPLHCAVASNCKESVELLLKAKAEVEHQDASYATPLHLALYNENYPCKDEKNAIVDLLYGTLSRDDKLFNVMDVHGLNYFHVAVSRNELDVVDALLVRGESVEHEVLHNHRQFAHYRPLHFAVRYGHLEMAKFLVERGADVTAVSKDGPPLHIAVEVGIDADIVDLLLENGAKVDAVREIDGKTVLHSLVETFVAKSEKLERVGRWLGYVERLARLVNHRDDNGNTALHLACEKIFYGIPCVRALLTCGADVNLENERGETPFVCAFRDLYRLNADSYMLLYHHVQALKVLGLPVNMKNDSCCQKILDESDECDPDAECFRMTRLDEMKLRRRREIAQMKRVKLATAVSLCGFLRLGEVDAAKYVTNETLKDVVGNDEELDEKYPVYGYLIRLQFCRGTRYRKDVSNSDDDVHRSAKRRRCDV